MHYIETLEDLDAKLKEAGDKLVVIDFFADWCGPCKMIAPKFEEFEKKYTNVLFYKVNVDEAGEITENYNVLAMPTFLFFKNGQQETHTDMGIMCKLHAGSNPSLDSFTSREDQSRFDVIRVTKVGDIVGADANKVEDKIKTLQ